jgi:hypothetical protein
MITKALICHSSNQKAPVNGIQVTLFKEPQGDLQIHYELIGTIEQIKTPTLQPSQPADNLWAHTCFELFFAVNGEDNYYEFNFSPSTQWAAYAFSSYRIRRNDWNLKHAPIIDVTQSSTHIHLRARIASADLPILKANSSLQLGLTAVIETNTGQHTYWALKHPEDQPNFHHRAGFITLSNLN